MILALVLALAVLGAAAPAAAQAPAGCRDAQGGRAQGLQHPVSWKARSGCGESTLVWFQTLAATDGAEPEWRVDDLLIVADLAAEESLSLLSPLNIECRHHADRRAFVIAAGAWGRTGTGGRHVVTRAWRLDAENRKMVDVPIRDVVCMPR